MSPDVLKERMRILGFTPKTFAQRVGSNERTVRRWWSGEQDVPNWVEVILDLMKDAQDKGHGEFYAAWNKAFNDLTAAFSGWVNNERPSYEDVALEIGLLTSDLCKAGKINPGSLDLRGE